MAYTQEQINSLQKIQTQLKTPEAFQNYVTQNYGADKLNEIKSNLQQNIQQPTQTLTQDQLKQKIATGNFSASEARQYNQMTGNNQGARDVALTSKEGVQNLQTTVTPEEAAKIAQAGITDVGTGVKPDMTAGTKEEFKQEITKSEKQTPTTTTDITYQEDKTPYDANKVISKAPQFTGADGKIYQTVRNSDNTLTTIDVTTGQPVTGKYTDAERDSIKQGFLKSPEQIQQETQQNIQLDPNNLFNQIRSGGVVSNDIKGTTEYKNTQNRINNLTRFENMSAKDLSYAINNGSLLPGTQTYNDLKALNPNLIRDAEQLNALNSALSTKQTTLTDTLTKITEEILKTYNGDINNYKTVLSQNPEVTKLNTDMATAKNELDSLKDNINNAYRDIEKELSGTGATKGYIQALASRRTEDLTRDYNAKLNEYNTMAGQLQTITENVKYEMELADKAQAQRLGGLQFLYGATKDEQAYQRGLEAEARQREYQMEDRAYNEELQQRQLEQKYAYEYGDLNSDNPTLQNIAIERAVASMYENYPIPGMESQSVKVQKVKNLMAQGMTGTQAIAQVESEIRNSQRYKDYLAYERARITPQTDTKFGFQNVGDGTIAVTDPATGQVIFEKLTDTQNKVINLTDGEVGGQCGTYARQYTGITGSINSLVGPTITERKKSFTEKQPQVGGLALFTGHNYDKTYGHIGVITGINADGTLTITESNLRGDEKITTRVVNPNEVTGFYNNTPMAKQMTGTINNGYSQEVKNWGDNIINNVGGAKITSIKDDTLRSQVSSYIAEKNKKEPNQNVAILKSNLSLLEELENHPGLKGAIGVGTKGFFPASSSAGFLSRLEQLEAKQFMEGIQSMKGMGALSNAEGLKVSASISSLNNTKQSEKDWKAELQKVKTLLQQKLSGIEENTGLIFDNLGRPLNNTDTTGTSTQNTGRWQSQSSSQGRWQQSKQ